MSADHENPCPGPEELSAWYDSELIDEELASHLADCPRCQRLLRDYRQLDRRLDDLLTPPQGAVERIRTGCRQRLREAVVLPYPRWLRVAGSVAAILLLALLVRLRLQDTVFAEQPVGHHLLPDLGAAMPMASLDADHGRGVLEPAPQPATIRLDDNAYLRVVGAGDELPATATERIRGRGAAGIDNHVRHVWLVDDARAPLRQLQNIFPQRQAELEKLVQGDQDEYVLQLILNDGRVQQIVDDFYAQGFKLLSPEAPQPGDRPPAAGKLVQYEVDLIER